MTIGKMKVRPRVLAAVLALGIGAGAGMFTHASFREWDLNMRVPTASVKDSKLYRVFDCQLSVSPAEFELAGIRYRISDAWLEHRTEVHRVSIFFTRQEILPELVLCVDLGRDGAQADVWIKEGKHGHTFYSGVNGVRMTEVGVTRPNAFTLCTRDRRFEVQFRVEETPNSERSAAP